jgi:hypothetical protein
MTYTQNPMQTSERQYNFALLNGEIFLKITFIHLWANFKVQPFTFKKCSFSAIFKFMNLSLPLYAFD